MGFSPGEQCFLWAILLVENYTGGQFSLSANRLVEILLVGNSLGGHLAIFMGKLRTCSRNYSPKVLAWRCAANLFSCTINMSLKKCLIEEHLRYRFWIIDLILFFEVKIVTSRDYQRKQNCSDWSLWRKKVKKPERMMNAFFLHDLSAPAEPWTTCLHGSEQTINCSKFSPSYTVLAEAYETTVKP